MFTCSNLGTSKGRGCSAPTPKPPIQTSDLRCQCGVVESRDPAPCPGLPHGVQELRVQRGPTTKTKVTQTHGPALEIGWDSRTKDTHTQVGGLRVCEGTSQGVLHSPQQQKQQE